MLSPVRYTHCNTIYDLGGVEVIHRYADCTVFKSPCCGRTVDDRRWKSLPDVERVEQWEIRASRNGEADLYGRILDRRARGEAANSQAGPQ